MLSQQKALGMEYNHSKNVWQGWISWYIRDKLTIVFAFSHSNPVTVMEQLTETLRVLSVKEMLVLEQSTITYPS